MCRKRICLSLFFLFTLLISDAQAQSVGINTSGASPDPSAMLDVAASDKGVLIPRVQLDDVNTQAPISAAPVEGLLIYNATGSEPNGFYYWNGTQWVQVVSGTAGINSSLVLNGNTLELTDPGGTLTADLTSLKDSTDNDSVVGNEYNSSFTLSSDQLSITDPGNTYTVDLSPYTDSTDNDSVVGNEYNDNFTLSGDQLSITDPGNTYTVDLSPYTDSTDNDSVVGNEYNNSLILNGNTLELDDPGATLTEDLSALVNDADADPTNEYNTGLSLSNDSLVLDDGGGTLKQDLSSLAGPDLWSRDASEGQLYPSNLGDSVGIGVQEPNAELDIRGRDVDLASNRAALKITDQSDGDTLYMDGDEITGGLGGNGVDDEKALYLQLDADEDLVLSAGSGNSQVGIGSGANYPSHKFDMTGGDARFKGSGENYLLFTDASADKVGIATNTPTKGRLEVQGAPDERVGHMEGDFAAIGAGSIAKAFQVNNKGHGSGDGTFRAIQGVSTGNDLSDGRSTGLFGKAGGRDLNVGAYGKLNSGTGAGVYGTTSGMNLDLQSNSYAGYFNGDLAYTGNLLTPSDRRLKRSIEEQSRTLDRLLELDVYSYRFKPNDRIAFPEGEQFGFIAQEVEEVFPRLVDGANGKGPSEEAAGSGSFKKVRSIQFIPVLTQAIKDQQETIEKQEEQIRTLKKELREKDRELEKRLERLEAESDGH